MDLREVLKDILLNLLKNKENSTLEINSLKNNVFENETREESLLKELDDLHSSKSNLESQYEKLKSVFDFKVKALKTGHDYMARALTNYNFSLKRKLTSLNYSKDRLEKEKKDLIENNKSQSDTLAKFAKSKQELNRLLSSCQKPSKKSGSVINKIILRIRLKPSLLK